MNKEALLTKEAILDAFRFRHACKQFNPDKKIPEDDFAFILETGRLSPSSFGFEPWKFVVVQNKELREKLAPVSWGAKKQLPTSSHFVVILTRTPQHMKADSDFIRYMMKEIQQLPDEVAAGKQAVYGKFLETDFGLLGNERAMFEWACRQTYIALGNMMTAAAMIGIDSCPIEGFDKKEVERELKEAGIIKNDEYGISCMAAFGYRTAEPRGKTRQPAGKVIEWIN